VRWAPAGVEGDVGAAVPSVPSAKLACVIVPASFSVPIHPPDPFKVSVPPFAEVCARGHAGQRLLQNVDCVALVETVQRRRGFPWHAERSAAARGGECCLVLAAGNLGGRSIGGRSSAATDLGFPADCSHMNVSAVLTCSLGPQASEYYACQIDRGNVPVAAIRPEAAARAAYEKSLKRCRHLLKTRHVKSAMTIDRSRKRERKLIHRGLAPWAAALYGAAAALPCRRIAVARPRKIRDWRRTAETLPCLQEWVARPACRDGSAEIDRRSAAVQAATRSNN
jgi:hypothetical protein